MSSKLALPARAATLCLLLLIACRARDPHLFDNPAESYSQIHDHFLRGQLDLSRREAAGEKTSLLAHDAAWSFRFCLLEAEILQFQGRSQELVDVLTQQARSFAPSGDLAIKQAILLSLAEARLGHQQQSTQKLNEAIRLSAQTNSPLEGEVLRTAGLLANRRGDQVAANRSLHASLAFAQTHADVYLEASDLLNLGHNALQDDHIDEALDDFNASSRLAETIHADVILESDEGNAGSAYFSLGDFERSLDSFRRAEVQAHRLGATDSDILWLKSEGLALSRLGDALGARSRYEQAIEAAHAAKETARLPEIDVSLAALSLQLGQLDAARAQADEAHRAAAALGDTATVLDASLIQALAAARTPNDAAALPMLLTLLESAREVPSILWVAEDALAGLYASRHQSASADLWHRRSIHTFESQRDSVADEEQRLPFFDNGGTLYLHYAEFLIAGGRSDEALSLLDSARARTLREGLADKQTHGTYTRPVRAARLVQAREGPSIILFYALGPQRSYLWEIDRRGTHLVSLPEESLLSAHIKSYQSSILRSHDPIQEHNADALWLFDQLVGPVAGSIPSGSRVLIVPDGVLNGFNLETLLKPGPQGMRYWIEDVALTTASSMQSASWNASTASARGASTPAAEGLLLLGDPAAAGADYPTLPHAAEEVDRVGRAFPAALRTTIAGLSAIPDAYAASHPERYAYLHFVAHGMASSLRPLDSAIVLSPAPNDRSRFKLYAREIVHQPLQARLVTISSCFGSGVRSYAGEGLVGLSWAFLRAGAHQVIGALWEVNDSSTPQLMDRMYHELAAGAQPDQALRTAKLAMLHSPEVFRKPLYWAAFQIYAGS